MRDPGETSGAATGPAATNQVRLGGRLLERGVLRHTPAGVAVLDFRLAHCSIQPEAGGERRVEVELACIAFEHLAQALAAVPLGTALCLGGFLAARSRKSASPVLHTVTMEFIEGS